MLRTIAVDHQMQLIKDVSINDLTSGDFIWYWIDFNQPTEDETDLLRTPLNFHPLAIEDCIHKLQRPKLDYYEDHTFFVTHSLNPETFSKEEINIFVADNFIVTYHHQDSLEINEVWDRVFFSNNPGQWDPYLVLYHVLDKLVDNYFPVVYQIEDTLNEIDENSKNRSMEALLDDLYETRHQLLALRHTVTPMRDLIYRMLNSHRLTEIKKRSEYFSDIHDHLLKLTEMIESNRELTTDIRDSYLSLNSHETNRVMKVLTVITTIFMPLTLIAGIYGMNFEHMPELKWKYGYFGTLLFMFVIGFGMFFTFKKKGWFK
ncbi:magnesium/cobalt transporter CorA [Bacillus methanolicus]|uniref:Magnesium transport protein CorA n=1 Tax=Bacillus methanolicus (strain MGA3 / ATCC 53907) TaxID=796606 RepID=I3DUC9_BACMM|nr:magnesium/cobalt transporter CorA [Bacillus methanolicus]AIE61264.1 Putative metal ion transporter YfjQ [Bacillus methanolicus MGA3]EIJ77850.1 magnesium/cobalt transporter CorA [Bacillus methanolicus MGA3]UQD53248.1 magnesium and cobalt transport protein CorA [Bacillus methanolicus]